MSADSFAEHVQNFFFILKVMAPHATVAIHCLARPFPLIGTMIVPIEDDEVYIH